MEFILGALGAYMALGVAGMAVVGLALLAAIVSAFMEKGLVSFLALAALCAGIGYFGHLNPLAFFAERPFLTGGLFLGYFGVGAAWSLSRFWLYQKSLSGKFTQFKDEFLSRSGVDALDKLLPDRLEAFKGQAAERMNTLSRSGSYPATPATHKADIFFWMGWWPVSIAAYAFDEPIKRLLEFIYRSLSGVYVKIAKEQSAEYVAAMGGK